MVHINSDTGAELPPSVLAQIGKFTEYVAPLGKENPFILKTVVRTLQKIHTFVEAQQNGNTLKNFLHQGEMSKLLKGCRTGLQQGLEVFKV
jgi:hypothetical protein